MGIQFPVGVVERLVRRRGDIELKSRLCRCELSARKAPCPHFVAKLSDQQRGPGPCEILQMQNAFSVQVTNLLLILFGDLQMAQPVGSDAIRLIRPVN
jgi:hypothetical protein